MKVSGPTKLESLELDLPRGSYEFSKLRIFCRSKNQQPTTALFTILIRKMVDLDYIVKMRVEDP